jgi:putative intracellular protease/amidase
MVKGRKVTGFSNGEEQISGLAGTVPFLLESTLVSQGASYSKGPDYTSYIVTDGNIITGQNPASSIDVAKKMLSLMKDLSKKVTAALN